MSNQIVLDLSHRPDNPRNSEGSFATLRDGRIIFIYTHYYGTNHADEATARLCARYSSDGGRTWSAEDEVVLENKGRTWKHHKLLEKDPTRGFCYTAIHFVDDSVLLAYCCGGGKKSTVLQDLCIRRLKIDWMYQPA